MLKCLDTKRKSDKNEVELNTYIIERIYNIIDRFKVVPGIDENDHFDKTLFKTCICYVKKWAEENDRNEVEMNIMGSGLSYAQLNEEKMPPVAIMDELNRAENEELRIGYYLEMFNQRNANVHFVDPEGKPELALSKDFRGRANMAEEKGYSRYADALNKIADMHDKEARDIIATKSKM